MFYRREIDGLRALAVLPVILFHSGVSSVSGGFVGVDIFFVISGYLIATLIAEEIEKGSFSLCNFYFRRAKRILPMLFVVMAVCIPFAWLYLSPDQMKDFMQSLAAVALFSSNILFLIESDYFATLSEEKPLLHTWSLAVEEQFYFIFPLLLISIGLSQKKRFVVFSILTLFSLFLFEYIADFSKDASFYLLPTRAWELMSGVLCALILFKRNNNGNDALSFLGMGLILLPMVSYDYGEPLLPYVLAAVLGTSLIILFTSSKTYIGKLLSIKPIVGIGLISYSAYLWHQPLFAFAKVISLKHPSSLMMWSLILATLFLSFFSWRYVEQPFRKVNFPLQQRGAKSLKPFLPFTVISLFFISIGFVGHINGGFESRFEKPVLELLKAQKHKNPNRAHCHYSSQIDSLNIERCHLFSKESTKKVLIWGDSHVDSIAWELAKELSTISVSTTEFSYSGCPPLQGVSIVGSKADFQCEKFNHLVLEHLKTEKYDAVILLARWPLLFSGSYFDNGEGGIESRARVDYYMASGPQKENNSDRKKDLIIAYQDSIKTYLTTGAKIIVVEPIPEAGWDVPHRIAKVYLNNNEVRPVSTNYSIYTQRNKDTIQVLESVTDSNLYWVKPEVIFCDSFISERCINSTENQSFYTDDDHLSKYGSKLLAKEIKYKVSETFN